MTENFIGVFDGVGEGQYWSGEFARELARTSQQSSTMYFPNANNRSKELLLRALGDTKTSFEKMQRDKAQHLIYKHRSVRGKDLQPRDGSSTALVLSLVRKDLYDSVYGDCRWALLRMENGVYKCVHISKAMYMPKPQVCAGEINKCKCVKCDPVLTPRQLGSFSVVEDVGKEPGQHGRFNKVQEGDLVFAASDGFWDNAEIEWGEKDLSVRLAECANAAVEQSGSEPLVRALGQRLADMAMKRMDMVQKDKPSTYAHGKPDDLSLVVAVVSMRLGEEGDGHPSDAHGDNCDKCKSRIDTERGHAVYVRATIDSVKN
jgi:serine/threonine protein phosphatase PrpC